MDLNIRTTVQLSRWFAMLSPEDGMGIYTKRIPQQISQHFIIYGHVYS
jgi:hypothetical protein